jgi:integrase
MLNAFYAELLLSGRSNQENGLSPRTVRYIHTILRKALKDAVRWNHLARNVADSADPPKPRTSQARLVQTWTAPQLRCFLDHVKGDRLYPAYLLAATTGMRRGEIGGLRWQDIDFDTSRVAVRQTLIVVGYQLHWSTPKTDRGRRNIAIDPATMDALRSHKAAQAAEKLVIGPDYADSDLVFSGPTAHRPTPKQSQQPSSAAQKPRDCPASGSTTCATPTPPSPYKRASTRRSSANGSATLTSP